MQMLDILGEMGGIQSVARELGISEGQAASGAAALLPALLGGFKARRRRIPPVSRASSACWATSVAVASWTTC